jgi:hypothetical protein
MVNYGDLQFAERIMVARRSEMSAEWKVRFAICIASVAIQAFTKLLFSFSDVLKTTNCTFQEVDNIFCLAVGIAVYDEFYSCMCVAELLCALDVFARHTSSRITFLTLSIVGRSRGDIISHQDIFQTFGFPARQKIVSTSWNVQFVAFNASEKLNNNLVNASMATEANDS